MAAALMVPGHREAEEGLEEKCREPGTEIFPFPHPARKKKEE